MRLYSPYYPINAEGITPLHHVGISLVPKLQLGNATVPEALASVIKRMSKIILFFILQLPRCIGIPIIVLVEIGIADKGLLFFPIGLSQILSIQRANFSISITTCLSFLPVFFLRLSNQ